MSCRTSEDSDLNAGDHSGVIKASEKLFWLDGLRRGLSNVVSMRSPNIGG